MYLIEMPLEIRGELARDLEKRSGPYISRIDKVIDEAMSLHGSSNFFEPLTYATKGGKRIRPMILMLSAESVGDSSNKTNLASVAIELLHTESIIHDDIIDAQTSRRDRVAFHVKYGYSASILTADFVFGIILDIASRYNDTRISRELSLAALKMCEGEFREVMLGPGIKGMSWDDYIKVISEKTASLFRTASRLGAIVGSGSENEIDALSSYGMNLGIAYQIQDDILDWGENGNIDKSMKSNSNDYVDLERLRDEARVYSEKAKNNLNALGESESRDFLYYLADFTVMRNY